MLKRGLPGWTFAAIGLVAFLLLQLHFAAAWASYYTRFPIKGYEQAMADGRIPPSFMGSARSHLVGSLVLVFLPLATLWLREGRRRTAVVALWVGVVLANVIVWVGTESLREDSNMWPIDLVFVMGFTGAPLLLGALGQAVLENMTPFARNRPRAR